MARFKISEIFLVDDDRIVRMVATKILRSIDFRNTISVFENGQRAIDEIRGRIAHHKFEKGNEQILLLLDINMPLLDAWGFLDEFSKFDQEFRKHFFIVIITSSIDSNDRLKAFSYPDVLDFITKPLSGKHVIDFLTRHELYDI